MSYSKRYCTFYTSKLFQLFPKNLIAIFGGPKLAYTLYSPLTFQEFPKPSPSWEYFRWMLWTISDIYFCVTVSLLSRLIYLWLSVYSCFRNGILLLIVFIYKLFNFFVRKSYVLLVVCFCGRVLSINHENRFVIIGVRKFPNVIYDNQL